jgi:hypothetical protein
MSKSFLSDGHNQIELELSMEQVIHYIEMYSNILAKNKVKCRRLYKPTGNPIGRPKKKIENKIEEKIEENKIDQPGCQNSPA